MATARVAVAMVVAMVAETEVAVRAEEGLVEGEREMVVGVTAMVVAGMEMGVVAKAKVGEEKATVVVVMAAAGLEGVAQAEAAWAVVQQVAKAR